MSKYFSLVLGIADAVCIVVNYNQSEMGYSGA